MKRIAILGSTGSIGRQALEVIEQLGPAYKIVALTARSNAWLLEKQVKRFKPELAVLSDHTAAENLKKSLRGYCRVEAGMQGQVLAASWPAADLALVALVGFSGLEPTLAALAEGKMVALANKEALVVGGELITRHPLWRERLIPVDSEHSAIWQCLRGVQPGQLEKIWLTASGGPFAGWDPERMARATPADALAHPNWQMGDKVTIDSATMINKGLEVLGARWLFNLDLEKIRVLIHPQSVVHSMIELLDGSILAQVGPPDMRLPIQYALTFPNRARSSWPRLNLYGQQWSFSEPDTLRFPCLKFAYHAGQVGGTAPACLNAANEVAVEQFLKGKIKFGEIAGLVEAVMSEYQVDSTSDLPKLLAADEWARRKAWQLSARQE